MAIWPTEGDETVESGSVSGCGAWCVAPDGGHYPIDMPGLPKVATAPIPVGPGQPDTRRFFDLFALVTP